MTFRTSVIHIKYLQEEIKPDFSELNKHVIKEAGSDVAIIGLGDFYHLGKEVKELLKENHGLVITLESAVLDGGFGEKVTRFYGTSNMKVINFGAKKEFTDRVPAEEILRRNNLTKEQIVEKILKVMGK